MISLSYIAKALKLVFRYPSAIVELRKGITEYGLRIDRLRNEKWLINKVDKAHAYGFTIFLNKDDNASVCPSIGLDKVWELEQTEFIRKMLNPGMTFIDVGANIGWYTLLAAKKIGNEGLVVSFEPEPINFKLLEKSIQFNHFKNVRSFRECISDKEGDITLYIGTNPGDHSTVRQASDKNIKVKSTTIDSLIERLGIDFVDILKVDAEGAEPFILEGAKESLAKNKVGSIIMEWTMGNWVGNQVFLAQLFNNFEIYQFVKSPRIIKRIGKEHLESIPFCNILLKRKNKR
jgi:FkbM family methyltransferase